MNYGIKMTGIIFNVVVNYDEDLKNAKQTNTVYHGDKLIGYASDGKYARIMIKNYLEDIGLIEN